MTERLHFHFSVSCIGEGNGNPLQCSCLENPRDGGAWWAAIYGVAQSWTRLKRLSSSSLAGIQWTSLVAQLVKNLPLMQKTMVWFLDQEDPWRRDRRSTPVFLGFPGGSDGKESTCIVGDLGSISGLGRSSGGDHGNPFQYSCLENPMDRGAWLIQSMGSRRVR